MDICYKVMADLLNVRREPSLSARRWNSTWPIRQIALVRETDVASWYEITYRGEKAYVSSAYMLPLATVVSEQIPVRMLYLVASEIGRSNSRFLTATPVNGVIASLTGWRCTLELPRTSFLILQTAAKVSFGLSTILKAAVFVFESGAEIRLVDNYQQA